MGPAKTRGENTGPEGKIKPGGKGAQPGFGSSGRERWFMVSIVQLRLRS